MTGKPFTVGRRNVVVGALLASAAIAKAEIDASEADLYGPPDHAGHPVDLHPDREETFDVVVIGSGAAGLSAALEARKAGASTAVLEKMGSPGGNSIISGGQMTVPGSPIQKKLGIADSVEKFQHELLRAGYSSHPDRVETLGAHALDAFAWTRNELGVRWFEDRLERDDADTIPRAAILQSRNGMGLVLPMLQRARTIGVEIRLRTKALHLLTDPDDGGRVTGVLAEDTATGEKIRFRAKKGVVLASGGFGADIPMRQMLNWRLSERVGTTTQPGSTSEMLRDAARIGAWLIHLEYIHCVPDASPDEKGWGTAWQFSRYCASPFGFWVSKNTGERFVNELSGNSEKTNAVFDILNTGDEPLAIANADAVRHPQSMIFQESDVETLVRRGFIQKYSDIDSLAKGYGIPPGPLKQTIEAYNTAVKAGKPFDPMGRPIPKGAKPLTDGPWYVGAILAKVLTCSGGIAIDAAAHVLSVNDDEPIPGLYAAGEVTGGLSGISFNLTCGLLDAIVFGRIAGQQSAM